MTRRVKPLKTQWFHILIALAEGEKHGADIMRDVLDQTDGSLKLWPVTLYGALEQLTDTGWITELSSRGQHPAGESERKRYYRITGAGLRTVERETARLEELARKARLKLASRDG